MSFCSNIDLKSLNKHLFNIIKILFKFKIFNNHRIGKFSNNFGLRKLDFLSADYIHQNAGAVTYYFLTFLVHFQAFFVYFSREITEKAVK